VAIVLAGAGGPAAAAAIGSPVIDSAPVGMSRPAVATEAVQFDVFFPSRDPAGLQALLQAQQTLGAPEYHQWLTPAEYKARFGPDPAVLSQAESILNAAGLRIVAAHSQGLRVAGTAGALQSGFGTALDHVSTADGRDSLIARGGFVLPAALRSLGGMSVAFGPVRLQSHARRLGHVVPLNRNSSIGGYWFSDLKQAYDAPSYQALSGTGRGIGIVIDGDVQDTDMETYFGNENLPEPELIHIPVNGGAPFDPNGGSFEGTLDVQQSGGMAPNAAIRLYTVPALDDYDITSGIVQAIEDNDSDVVSMSFGACELLYTAAYNGGVDMTAAITVYEQVFQQGNVQGITFVASSGDNGGLQCPSLTKPLFVAGASYPATSPSVTAVGGTNLVTTFTKGSENSAYVSESAYGNPLVPYNPFGGDVPLTNGYWGSGGGPSIFFGKPSWQSVQGATARETPDLSLHMGGCPSTAVLPCGPSDSYDIEIIAGQVTGVIGTSASAPAFAGVVALYDQLTGTRAGNMGPMIYSLASAQKLGAGVYRRNIIGFNGVYSSDQPVVIPGVTVPQIPLYNMVIGNGTVDIRKFIGADNLPAAGVPGTPSNP
jgi:subtilase family serine protease